MSEKKTGVILFTPDGSSERFEDVTVTSYNQNGIVFEQREGEDEEVTVTTITSDLPYIIEESITPARRPKDLL